MTKLFTQTDLGYNIDPSSVEPQNRVGVFAYWVPASEYTSYGLPQDLNTNGYLLFRIVQLQDRGSGIPTDVAAGDFLCCTDEFEVGELSAYSKVVKLDLNTMEFVGTRYYSRAWDGDSRIATNEIAKGVQNIKNAVDALGVKLDSEIALTEGIRGAVVDVKNQPTDACIIRIYVGDQTNKRNAAAREITRLLGEGYRPYQTFGISEDLARVLFVKYPEPNDANVAP